MVLRKMMPLALLAAIIAGTSCNNSGQSESLQKQADSLFDAVIKVHDVGMPKIIRVQKMQARASELTDSIGKLPVTLQQPLATYKLQLDTLVTDLKYANSAMNLWMGEMATFQDTLVNNLPERIKFLNNEIEKGNKINQAILGSLAKADSLLKK
jgi:hypothetical protein